MIRVLLIDDHRILLTALEAMVEQADGMTVAGAFNDPALAVDAAGQLQPDVVLVDLSMPVMDGIEVTRRLCASDPSLRIVVLTAHDDRRRVTSAIEAGAIGYLLKDADPDSVLTGIRHAAAGDSPLDPRAAKILLEQRDGGPVKLSAREQEVLIELARGFSNKVIANRLGITETTVKAHLTKVFAALDVSDRTQAALWARENGLVDE